MRKRVEELKHEIMKDFIRESNEAFKKPLSEIGHTCTVTTDFKHGPGNPSQLCKVLQKCSGVKKATDKKLYKKVHYNPPMTVVIWNDDTKTLVKATDNEQFDPERGFLQAFYEKHSGLSKTKGNKVLHKLRDEYEDQYPKVEEESESRIIERVKIRIKRLEELLTDKDQSTTLERALKERLEILKWVLEVEDESGD